MKNFILYISICSLFFLLCSCTFNFSMVHTEGSAADLIDDTTTDATELSIPASVVP